MSYYKLSVFPGDASQDVAPMRERELRAVRGKAQADIRTSIGKPWDLFMNITEADQPTLNLIESYSVSDFAQSAMGVGEITLEEASTILICSTWPPPICWDHKT